MESNIKTRLYETEHPFGSFLEEVSSIHKSF